MSRHTSQWSGHVGHKLQVQYAGTPTDFFTAPPVCLFCTTCDVQLDAASPREPDKAKSGRDWDARVKLTGPLGTSLAGHLVDLIAGLHGCLATERGARNSFAEKASVPFADDSYWLGYHHGGCSGREIVYAQMISSLEILAAECVPAVNLTVAGRTVRAAISDRLRRLRPELFGGPDQAVSDNKAKNTVPTT